MEEIGEYFEQEVEMDYNNVRFFISTSGFLEMDKEIVDKTIKYYKSVSDFYHNMLYDKIKLVRK